MKDGKPNGIGKLDSEEYGKYIGEWKDGYPFGIGELKGENFSFIGEFKEENEICLGIFKVKNIELKGYFKNFLLIRNENEKKVDEIIDRVNNIKKILESQLKNQASQVKAAPRGTKGKGVISRLAELVLKKV